MKDILVIIFCFLTSCAPKNDSPSGSSGGGGSPAPTTPTTPPTPSAGNDYPSGNFLEPEFREWTWQTDEFKLVLTDVGWCKIVDQEKPEKCEIYDYSRISVNGKETYLVRRFVRTEEANFWKFSVAPLADDAAAEQWQKDISKILEAAREQKKVRQWTNNTSLKQLRQILDKDVVTAREKCSKLNGAAKYLPKSYSEMGNILVSPTLLFYADLNTERVFSPLELTGDITNPVRIDTFISPKNLFTGYAKDSETPEISFSLEEATGFQILSASKPAVTYRYRTFASICRDVYKYANLNIKKLPTGVPWDIDQLANEGLRGGYRDLNAYIEAASVSSESLRGLSNLNDFKNKMEKMWK